MFKHSKTINSDEIPIYSKFEIALHQLEQSINFYLDDKDYICAITLAGASEELLGKLLETEGKESDLTNFVNACVDFSGLLDDEKIPRKEFVAMANYHRDHLKHIKDGSDVSIGEESARRIIDRALNNFWTLTNGKQSEIMKRYYEVRG